MEYFWVCIAILFAALFAGFASDALFNLSKSPFKRPQFDWTFDVSRKRSPDIDDYIDQFLIDGGLDKIRAFEETTVYNWKLDCEARIRKSIFKARRRCQYQDELLADLTYTFRFVRSQTRYSQRNYVRTPYEAKIQSGVWTYDMAYLKSRYRQLKEINFECTLNAWHCKNQRKLATRELREKVMARDDYTCQRCGKYMPDEVGLHVDHIVPVSKGGKTVMSNLQVLCSKCNLSKSDKI